MVIAIIITIITVITAIITITANNNINDSCNRTESLLDSLCDEIGRRCNAQFAVGEAGDLEDRCGILDEVGNNFIVLRSADTGNRLFCNASNLQFISFFNQR